MCIRSKITGYIKIMLTRLSFCVITFGLYDMIYSFNGKFHSVRFSRYCLICTTALGVRDSHATMTVKSLRFL